MPRHSIEDLAPLRRASSSNQPDVQASGWERRETETQCEWEDRLRKPRLEAAAANADSGGKRSREAARELARHLEQVLTGRPARLSAASRLQMRDWRGRLVGALDALLGKLDEAEWMYFTLVPPGWWVSAAELKQASARRLMARLRTALHRAGSARASGWLYAMLHGGYDGTTDGFPLHVHGIATKGMVEVLRNLRAQPQFCRNSTDGDRYPQVTSWKKLQIDRPRGSRTAGISYTCKSIWTQHNTEVDADGKRRRVGKPHRIGGKAFIQHLLWLHSQSIKDQVLLVHLSVVGGKLIERKRGCSAA